VFEIRHEPLQSDISTRERDVDVPGHTRNTACDDRDPTDHEAVPAMLVENGFQRFERASETLREPYASLATHGFFNFAQSLRVSAISRSRT